MVNVCCNNIAKPEFERLLSTIRQQIENGQRQQARSIAHRLLDDPATRTAGYIGSAICAVHEGLTLTAMRLFQHIAEEVALALAPFEYIAAVAIADTARAAALLEALPQTSTNDVTLQEALIPRTLATLVAQGALRPADAARLSAIRWPASPPLSRLRKRLETLDSVTATDRNAQDIALVSWLYAFDANPYNELTRMSALYHLFNELGAINNFSQGQGAAASSFQVRILDLETSTIRDAPPWLFVAGVTLDLNFLRRLQRITAPSRCFFLSVNADDAAFLADYDAREYLRACSPIGCRDWPTAFLLQQAGVPAFVAGTPLFCALPSFTFCQSELESQSFPSVRMRRAQRKAEELVRSAKQDETSIVRHIVARSAGCESHFRGPTTSALRYAGIVNLDDQQIASVRTDYTQRLRALIDSISQSHEDVDTRRAWQEICHPALRAMRASRDRPFTHCRSVDSEPLPAREPPAPTPGSCHRIEIAVSVDSQLADELPVLLESICDNTALPARVHILARDVDDKYRALICRAFADLEPTFHHCDNLSYGDEVRLLAHTSISTLDRLRLPELVPELDRILYLDVDLVVLGDLSDLWRFDLNDMRLAAKSSTSSRLNWVHQMIHQVLSRLPYDSALAAQQELYSSYDLTARAFNAGVLVMNLARMRRERFVERFVPMVERYGMNDQDVLNLYAGHQRAELPAEWNVIPRQDCTDNAKIIHFAGPTKPWSESYVHRAYDYERYRAQYMNRVTRLHDPN